MRSQSRQRIERSGILKFEILMSCLLMTALMGIATTMVYRINGVWRQGQQFQFAASELANELDRVTRLPREQAEIEIGLLQPSEICQQKLAGANLKGELSEDPLGTRVTLELGWDRTGPAAQPVRLVGWLIGEESQ